MQGMRCCLLLMLMIAAWAAQVPPSPSTHPGVRVVPGPHWLAWPSIVYVDELRDATLRIPYASPRLTATLIPPVRWADTPLVAGRSVTLAWLDTRIQLPLSVSAADVSVLLRLPAMDGLWSVRVEHKEAPLRIIGPGEACPELRMSAHGLVDASGVAVVLRMARPDPAARRRYAMLRAPQARGDGPAVVVGDPCVDLDGRAILADDRLIVAQHPRLPAAAAMAGLLAALVRQPRTLVWIPAGIDGDGDDADALERIPAALMAYCDQCAIAPDLVLGLATGYAENTLRRKVLRRICHDFGWRVVSLGGITQGPEADLVRAFPSAQEQQAMRLSIVKILDD